MSQSGLTFSYRHAEFLGLDAKKTFSRLLKQRWSIIRLPLYWDDVQPKPGVWDFSRVIEQLKECERRGQSVVMCLGIKSPRWPEFYWPSWIESRDLNDQLVQSHILTFVQESAKRLAKFSCITHWQVENEPLDRSGPQFLKVPLALLQTEVALVRSLDSRPIVLTAWGNDLSFRNALPELAKMADVLGIDIYYQQFFLELFGRSFYRGPQDSLQRLQKLLSPYKQPIWIAELQGEPWGKDHGFYLNPGKTFTSQQLRNHWQNVRDLPLEKILWWGCEFWYYQAGQGNQEYLEAVKEIHQ